MRSIFATCLFGLLLASMGCRSKPQSTSGSASAITTLSVAGPTHGVLPMDETVKGRSIYALNPSYVGHDGRPAKLDTFRGSLVLISMFYASCPHACPTLISNIKRIDAALDEKTRSAVRVLLVSFDPAKDTPEALTGVIAAHHLDTRRWLLATATEADARELGAVLGIRYRDDVGEFSHTSVITLLDKEGKIDLRVDGLTDGSAAMAARIRELVASSGS